MKVAIIGAGASGLAAARRATQYGLEVIVFEEKDCVGGIWMYNEEPVEGSSPLYANLRTNLPVQLMQFRGYEFKAKSGLCYPFHYDVLKYLNDFADNYNLRKCIKFHSSVIEVARLKTEWKVTVKNTSKDSSNIEQYLFNSVMVCNGHYFIPFIPYLPGQETFSGQIVHSRTYRRSTAFEGRRLLIVGAGASALDIAAECSNVATKVTVSCRRKEIASKMDRSELLFKSGIKQIQSDKVVFDDDTSIEVDIILLCTGYLYELPFLNESCCIKVYDGKVIEPLFQGFINIMHPSMCFIGILQKTFVFPLVDLQAEVFVKHLTGRIQLPDRYTMLMSLHEENTLKKKMELPKSHFFYVRDIKEYCTTLFHLGNIEPFAPVLYKIYHRDQIRKKQPKKTFLTFEIVDDENFICYDETSLLNA